ncbi:MULTISPECIES: heme/hemin ABC transporter substrate-binding protein [unclassified Aureimonas]|uniref:heme/hemin ABC transporter substrate-binding protein n=1 Tax=unclassified Aureimonas TaxID=2615206 RepID=UPI0006FC25E1|nr:MULTISPECIES: ABC transporter substrate-binding protein [unclassified Aureimonas]KQT53824.1 hypothetical protein ASG62_11285 [Aureimonas sp. Leaf427]KQT71735.1 hypothetical protein ASG54_19875 [Aureimonas sp. Leaf460]
MTPFPAAASSLRVLLLSAGLLAAAPALAEGPSRIVSIGGATTEILYALGEEKRIAAVDSTSLFPPEAAASHPNVGYMRALSAEGILAQAPDLILMEAGSGPPEAVKAIDGAGIPVVHVPAGFDASGIAGKVRTVAKALGDEAEGEVLAGKIDAEFAALAADLSKLERRPRVLFIYSLVDGRPMAAGGRTAADGIMTLAGATNVLSGFDGYKTLSWEAATELQPDVILMGERAGAPTDRDAILALPAIAATPAGRDKALVSMDMLYLLGFGPRTPAAARDLAARLHPELPTSALPVKAP